MVFRLVGGVFVVVASVFASSCNPDPENGAAVPETTTITETSLAPPSSPPVPHATEAPQDQAKFAAALPQLDCAEAVLGPMGRVDRSQSYGLGQLPDAAFKGGWGPDPSGSYLTRQFRVVGDHGVAVAVIPADGTYESGQRLLDRIAQEVLRSVEEAG